MREIKCVADLERYTSCPYCRTAYAYTENDILYLFPDGKTWSYLYRSKGTAVVECPKCEIVFEV